MKTLTSHEEILCICALETECDRIVEHINQLKDFCDCENREDAILRLQSMIDFEKRELSQIEKLIEKLRG